MINSRNLDDKTYEELIAAALAQIPLYSKEWTNFNPSDPGITVLENLSAFQAVQQASLNQVTDAIRLKLLKMAGYEPSEGGSAKVLLRPEGIEAPLLLPSCQKFYSGDICFETAEEVSVSDGRILGIYAEAEDGNFVDYTETLNSSMPVSTEVFGEKPEAGRSLYLVLSSIPNNRMLRLYVKTEERFSRNPIEPGTKNRFARVCWSYASEKGYETAEAEDDTCAFLVSGEIRLKIGKARPVLCRQFPCEGYVIKCTLEMAEYDIPPRILKIDGFLFEVLGRDTKAVTYTVKSADKIELFSGLAEEGYLFVYGKRRKSDSFYYEYTEAVGEEKRGCFYEKKKTGYGKYEILFDKERFGYAPAKNCEDGVKIVCCTYEMMLHRKRGILYGYDNQEISLNPFEHVQKENLMLLLRKTETNGRARCTFVSPMTAETGDGFLYEYDPAGNVLRIKDCGEYEEAEIFLCGCSVSMGENGNVRVNNEFFPDRLKQPISFKNPAKGRGGAFWETVEEVTKRFAKEMEVPRSAVTAKDYEYLVKNIPGLCIHKVKAVMDRQKNRVCLYVKPYHKDKFPGLPVHYKEIIEEYLDKRRLLTTKVAVFGPSYVRIDVQAIIYVKHYYKNSQEKIEAEIRKELDYTEGDKNMGETVYFNQVLWAVEALDCVDYIYDFKLIPAKSGRVCVTGMDIRLLDSCLCYPGELMLELNYQEALS